MVSVLDTHPTAGSMFDSQWGHATGIFIRPPHYDRSSYFWKVTVQVPCPLEGTLSQHSTVQGEEYPVQDLLAVA